MTRRLPPWLLLPVLGLMLLGTVLLARMTLFRSPATPPVPPDIAGSLWPVARPLESVSLPRVDGGVLSSRHFEGRWTLAYFGYLQCPDVCPTTLASMAALKRRLEADPAGAVVPRLVFVSVDPANDTPAAIAAYTSYFDPDIVGVRAEPEALAAITQAFGVFYEEQVDERGVRSVAHTTSVLLIDPAGRAVAALSTSESLALFERQYRSIIEYLGATTPT